MPRVTVGTVVKLLIWSIVVGAVLAFFNLTPQELFGGLLHWLADILRDFQRYAGTLASYLLLGAVVVVPIWALSYLWRLLKSRS